jgi:hypothetical protein
MFLKSFFFLCYNRSIESGEHKSDLKLYLLKRKRKNMWVIKILNSENKYEEHHYETMEKASEDYASFTDGIYNNDDSSIKKIQIDSVIFPTDPLNIN